MVYNNPVQAAERVKALILNDKKIHAHNKELVLEYINFLKARAVNDRTILKNLYGLKWFLRLLDGIDAAVADKKDIEKVMAKLESAISEKNKGRPLATETKRNIRIVTRQFYKHAFGEDEFYPKTVAWIKTGIKSNKTRQPDSILTDAEIQQLIGVAMNMRDRAIVAVLADTGIRVGELLGMKIKDVEFSGGLAHINVNGKTGYRRVIITDSEPHLRGYMNLLPDTKPTEPLWRTISNNNGGIPGVVPLDYGAITKIMRTLKERAKIDKKCNPHSFRHAAATKLAGLITEQEMKKYLGWSGASQMAAVYVHMNDQSLDKKMLEVRGYAAPEAEMKKSQTRGCFKCKRVNPLSNKYCLQCGTPLDLATATKTDSLNEMAMEAAMSPEKIAMYVEAYLDGRQKKERK